MSNTTETMPTNSFDLVNSYLGWGDPYNGIWFIGLEEGLGWDANSEHEISNDYKGSPYNHIGDHERDWKKLGNHGKAIRDYTSKIVYKFSSLAKNEHLSWRDYRDKILWREDSQVFQANLFPLGKSTTGEWPQHFKKLFGFGPEQRNDYIEHTKKTRFVEIKKLWEQCSAKATICFGKEGWVHFNSLFGTENAKKDEIIPNKIYANNDKKIIFSPHFARHMSTEKVNKIVERLNSWNVHIN